MNRTALRYVLGILLAAFIFSCSKNENDEDFNIWLIDHSRAFMRNDETRYLPRVTGCSRELYERLQALTYEQLEPLLSPPLTDSEVRWVLRRRDKVIEHIDALIAERGEGAVLFESGQ